MCNSETQKMRSNLLHSDWLKFEMEEHFLIGREQLHHQGALLSIVSTDLIGREPSRDI